MNTLLAPEDVRSYDEQFAAIRAMHKPLAPAQRFEYSIENVEAGGYIRFEGKSYRVQSIFTYEREEYRWPELTLYCLNDGATQYLEWEKEDEVSVYVSREKLTFGQVGINNKEHLWEISEKESGRVRYDGRTFEYHEDSAVSYIRDEKSEPFHQYLFAADANKAYISVEEWGDDDDGYEHNVTLSEKIDPRSIEVLVAGGRA
jgi:hypothetical protein